MLSRYELQFTKPLRDRYTLDFFDLIGRNSQYHN